VLGRRRPVSGSWTPRRGVLGEADRPVSLDEVARRDTSLSRRQTELALVELLTPLVEET